ncbi:MAG: MBL fold metallo-hydrolase, partial [Desulfamplus sp.]|nr:MBL fold metallo-hydrolase [Desulfamplus sp.]
MKITALIENIKSDSRSDLETEHGLSLHIEHNNLNILFDTGGSEAFGRNAAKLGIDLTQVDIAILSHHHYDHGGGLPWFISKNLQSKIYLGRPPSGDLWFKAFGGLLKKNIGLDSQLFIANLKRFVFLNTMTEIAPDIFVLTDICKKYPRPKGNRKLLIEKNGDLEPDNFEHEIIIVLKDRGELVVITGCSHSGILNMVETVVRNFSDIPIKALVGGFHLAGIPIKSLMPESRQEIQEIAAQILKYSVKRVYTGHCTGMKGYNI